MLLVILYFASITQQENSTKNFKLFFFLITLTELWVLAAQFLETENNHNNNNLGFV